MLPTKRRGRAAGFRMSDEHRTKIKNSAVLNALIEHVEGRREMTATQVSAGLGLLRKCLPDLSATQVSSEGDGGPVQVVIFKNLYEDDAKNIYRDGNGHGVTPAPMKPNLRIELRKNE